MDSNTNPGADAMTDRHAWTNEGMNRWSREDARALAQGTADAEGRVVTVAYDLHGGYPAHYHVLAAGERMSAFERCAFVVSPD